ncbi:MAG: GYD domain-containing protein [Nitrososphaeraceae archaeon]|nr:GYD domain-containing protein [Nitrososphaeraceae archaeon]
MSQYILLINWTQQGISKIKESSDRYNSFKASVEKAGGKVIGGYYTFGEYDVIIIIEAPNDEVVMSLMLKVGSAGNVRTKTLKAFTAEEGMNIIKNFP